MILVADALSTARTVIAADREVLIRSCTLGGDLATLDAVARPDLEIYDAALAKIDAAMETLP